MNDNFGRGHDKEFDTPQMLSPETPKDPSDIVIAQNSDGRYGVYIEDDWYGSQQALVILKYLEKHRVWLEQTAQENMRESEYQEVWRGYGYETQEAFLQAIEGGEMACILLPDEQRGAVLRFLEHEMHLIEDDETLKDGLNSLVKQLNASVEREEKNG